MAAITKSILPSVRPNSVPVESEFHSHLVSQLLVSGKLSCYKGVKDGGVEPDIIN